MKLIRFAGFFPFVALLAISCAAPSQPQESVNDGSNALDCGYTFACSDAQFQVEQANCDDACSMRGGGVASNCTSARDPIAHPGAATCSTCTCNQPLPPPPQGGGTAPCYSSADCGEGEICIVPFGCFIRTQDIN